MKIIYTRPNDNYNGDINLRPLFPDGGYLDGGISILSVSSKEDIERILGPISDEEYTKHVLEKSVPKGAINPRVIDDNGIPESREFRDAWSDVTPEAVIDIDLSKAKDIQLKKLRDERDKELLKTDTDYLAAVANDDAVSFSSIKEKKKKLRDATEALKNLQVSGHNDKDVLKKIRDLGALSKNDFKSSVKVKQHG